MSNTARLLIRFPVLLLAVADLVLLNKRLGPWQQVSNLPGNGSTGYDPAICLLVYTAVVLWLTSKTGIRMVSAPVAATLLGALSGGLLVARVWLVSQPSAAQTGEMQSLLLVAAAFVCGLAGVPAVRAAKSAGASLFAGFWTSIVAGLIGCAAVLGEFFILGPPPATQDSYKQFQEIGIGSDATVTLVHSLTAATALLLLGPLVGSALALIFGWMGQRRKG